MKRREVAEKAGFTRASSDWKEAHARERRRAKAGFNRRKAACAAPDSPRKRASPVAAVQRIRSRLLPPEGRGEGHTAESTSIL